VVSFLFLTHPSLGSKLPPGWYRPQYHLFPNRKGKIINELAGEVAALMTTLYAFPTGARPNGTLQAIFEFNIG
jgi:hypothetical protein